MKETLGLLTDGLKAGHVWLNGHNLGESPQTVPMYLPECWLKDGPNDLVVFDLQGANPAQLRLSRYEAFSGCQRKMIGLRQRKNRDVFWESRSRSLLRCSRVTAAAGSRLAAAAQRKPPGRHLRDGRSPTAGYFA